MAGGTKISHHRRRRQPHSTIISAAAILLISLVIFCDADDRSDLNIDDYPQFASQTFDISSIDSSSSSNLLDIRPVNYSSWNRNVTYVSSSAFNARGMAPLYNITNRVINLFVDADEPIPKG